MNIPAIRGKIGETVYYIANFSLKQVADLVKPVNDELHSAISLRDQLQRSLNNNYLKIKEYILSHNDRFFNSLVLAIYDGEPLWTEIRYELNDVQYSNVGILQLNGLEKIFPVDGQHRVEGIKAALKENPTLEDETISVILIGHCSSPEGMEKSRRIFSTLNRYAKPVGQGDIIALDEDDIVAISTRDILESNAIFADDRVKAYNSIAIPASDNKTFTSLIALYKCNAELLKAYYWHFHNQELTGPQIKDYLRTRPTDSEISQFDDYLNQFWCSMSTLFPEINSLRKAPEEFEIPAYRSKIDGGNVFYRPVFLLQFVAATARLSIKKNVDIRLIIKHYLSMPKVVSADPWNKVIWDPIKKNMITRNSHILYLILVSMYDINELTDKEINDLYGGIELIFSISRKESESMVEHYTLAAE